MTLPVKLLLLMDLYSQGVVSLKRDLVRSAITASTHKSNDIWSSLRLDLVLFSNCSMCVLMSWMKLDESFDFLRLSRDIMGAVSKSVISNEVSLRLSVYPGGLNKSL